MKGNRRLVILTALLLCLVAGLAGASDKVKVRGMITTRTGEALTLKTPDATTVTVTLTDDTKVQQPKGLGIRKRQMSAAVLIPGLRVRVEGTGDQSQVTASSITFDGDDLQTAEMIQAGLTPTARAVGANQQNIAANKQNISSNQSDIAANRVQTAANRGRIATNQQAIDANQQEIAATTKRFNELTEYDVKGDATVNFAVGSSELSSGDKATLSQLAQSAASLSGYIIEVKGFADSSGNAAMNQQLSMDRAHAVIAYLLQDCKVPIRHIIAPGAMGTADAAASNETSQGRAENRRVEVKVLVNKGLASS